jgi:leader peptidase (prepilin peptidase)/N-methyltransferase
MVWSPGVVVAFALGAVVGSFLNVVIHRLPRGESLSFPPSRCPRCGTKIRPWNNIPLLSYAFLRGRCRDCRERISLRYPLVEGLTALLAAGLWLKYGAVPSLIAHFVFGCGLIAVTFIDIDHMIIPDSLSLGGIVVGVALSLLTPVGWADSLIGVAVGGGSLLLVYFAYLAVTRREGMGLGDVKILAAIGAFLGWRAVLFTIFVSSVVGAVVGGAVVGFRLRRAIPFGAFLAFGALVYVFWGPSLIDWYLGIMS